MRKRKLYPLVIIVTKRGLVVKVPPELWLLLAFKTTVRALDIAQLLVGDVF